MEHNSSHPPHVLIYPLPLQGPIKCLLKLAELLCLAGIGVTFLNTDHNQRRLVRHTDLLSRFSRYPNFQFETIDDGLPEEHPRSGDLFKDIFEKMMTVSQPLFREMIGSGKLNSNPVGPVTCIIADGGVLFSFDVAEEFGVPLIFFDTISPCGLWTYFSAAKLIDAGEMPFTGNDLDAPIKNVPGMESFLRRRDLPSFFRAKDVNDRTLQLVMKECQQIPKSRGIILNTFDELDGLVLSHLKKVCQNIYTIGPLHTHLEVKLASEGTLVPATSTSLWQEDESCIRWLDSKPPNSVIYISIGSLAMMSMDQLLEVWHGVVNSGYTFLWVRRPNGISGGGLDGEIPAELLEATKERGLLVKWAPQEEVLAHAAVGGFLTHSGWNSTLESLMKGVPMLCWPYFVDQQVNSRFVSEVWNVGLDMKDTCDRSTIEKMIKDLMDERNDEFKLSARRLAGLGMESVHEGGSSVCNLKRLIKDIKSMV